MARADIAMVSTIDVPEMLRRLDDAERKVLTRHAKIVLKFVRAKWKGWDYTGRPKRAPINVSQKAWTSTVQTTETPFRLELRNQARAYEALGEGAYRVPSPGGAGEGYTAHVHRAGTTRLEMDVLAEAIRTEHLPTIKADLLAAIKGALGKVPTKKLRRGAAGSRRAGRALT